MGVRAALWNRQGKKKIDLVAVRRVEVDGLLEPHHGTSHFFLLINPPVGNGHSMAKPGGTEALALAQAVEKDRKSTRLNSSHVAISYAVFCLKKKTFKDCS